jgi:hypothetical protein
VLLLVDARHIDVRLDVQLGGELCTHTWATLNGGASMREPSILLNNTTKKAVLNASTELRDAFLLCKARHPDEPMVQLAMRILSSCTIS